MNTKLVYVLNNLQVLDMYMYKNVFEGDFLLLKFCIICCFESINFLIMVIFIIVKILNVWERTVNHYTKIHVVLLGSLFRIFLMDLLYLIGQLYIAYLHAFIVKLSFLSVTLALFIRVFLLFFFTLQDIIYHYFNRKLVIYLWS